MYDHDFFRTKCGYNVVFWMELIIFGMSTTFRIVKSFMCGRKVFNTQCTV